MLSRNTSRKRIARSESSRRPPLKIDEALPVKVQSPFYRSVKMRGSSNSGIRVFVFTAVLLCIAASSCTEQYARPYTNLRYPRLGDIEIPDVERVTAANGMQLFLVEDHELPLIDISALIRTGSIYE